MKENKKIMEMTDMELHELGLFNVRDVALASGIDAEILRTAMANSYEREGYGESVLIGYLADTSEPDMKTTHDQLLAWVEKFK